jgi:HEXXH motif-containing protein
LITTHSLPAEAFAELASGAGDSVVVGQLRAAQLSKHLMLLSVMARAADAAADPAAPPVAAFRAGYQLLARAQAASPGAVARLLSLPHVGSWAHDCLACLDKGAAPDFGYLAGIAAAAAVQLGIPFELDVPVRDGLLSLPGAGCLELPGADGWARLSSDGERVRVGRDIDVACAALVPDDGSGAPVPHWRGTPVIRMEAGGQPWAVLLETADRYLDRYSLPMLTTMTAAEVARWRDRVRAGWELLVRHHEWAAGPVADGVSVIVPLVPASDLDSAASPAAFGAVATSLPPSPVSMAETLVHEFQHIKLGGLMDMLPLVKPGDERGYAPWREDPRPMGGLLQGVYAFTGIVRFWSAQRQLATGPDDRLRADVLYERWRLAIELVTRDLLASGVLTPDGTRFVTMLRERGQHQGTGPVPAAAAEIAREVALDNWLTWQLRHEAVDAAEVAALAAAYQRGEPFGGRQMPVTRIEDDIRKVDSIARSRLLNMRYQDQPRYRQLSAADLPGLGPADALLVRGDATAAVATYREELAAEPDPAGWIGVALALHRLPLVPGRQVFAGHLPLLFEVHQCLADQGIHVDPLDLADWFA